TAAPAATAARPATAAPATTSAPAATTAPAATAASVRQPLSYASSQDVGRYHPQYSTQQPDTYMFDNLYDQLVLRDPDLKMQPGLATEWKTLNDTTWQFKLRPNVKFHDGSPFTAADIKFMIDLSKDPNAKMLYATTFETVDHVDIVDDLTVNVVT